MIFGRVEEYFKLGFKQLDGRPPAFAYHVVEVWQDVGSEFREVSGRGYADLQRVALAYMAGEDVLSVVGLYAGEQRSIHTAACGKRYVGVLYKLYKCVGSGVVDTKCRIEKYHFSLRFKALPANFIWRATVGSQP